MEGEAMKPPDTPFPRHWLYYIVLKIVVIAGAVSLALWYYGYWSGQGAELGPSTSLSVRSHAARRRADERRRLHARRQAGDRQDAGRARHRLCRRRLSWRQSD